MIQFDYNYLLLSDYIKIISVDSKCIDINTKRGRVTIKGIDMQIAFFSKEEIKIKGKINEVLFDE